MEIGQLTYADAKRIIKSRLRFGDARQIAALELVKAVRMVQGAAPKFFMVQCQNCEGQGEFECPLCSGDGCDVCEDLGIVSCEACGEIGAVKPNWELMTKAEVDQIIEDLKEIECLTR